MSRLLIKNLPPNATPTSLKAHFSSSSGPGGTLTDVKVALKPDGTSRRFGFVGYKTDVEALKAKEWYDRTYMGSSRLQVLISDGSKDAPVPRPNKRPRLGLAPAEEQPATFSNDKKEKSTPGSRAKSDKTMDEFLSVMQPRNKTGPSWADGVQRETEPVASTSELAIAADRKSTKKAKNEVPYKDISENVQMEDTVENNEAEQPSAAEPLSDLEWMRQRMAQNVEQVGRVFEQDDDDVKMAVEEDKPTDAAEPEPEDQTKQTILQTSRLFLRNLAFSCTEEDLRELCSRFGAVSQIHIPVDTKTKEPKGLAYVSFTQSASAVAAYEALDRKSFQGRLLHILAAVDRRGNIEVEDVKKKSVKEERASKKKAMAGKEFNWSMLYMNADAVASSIADRMSVSKSDILNPDSETGGSNPAVRLALAETHVINETKSYLETHGVNLSSFTSKARSDTTILVKNIPYGTAEEQIREMFEPHGTLSRVLVPPAGTIAVVDYERPEDAKEGFKRVAYRRLGNSIVYLEKGPLGIWEGAPPPTTKADSVFPTSTGGPVVKITDAELESQAAEEPTSIAEGSTLYIKNLSFATTSEKLISIFQHFPSFSFARVQMKPDPKKPGMRQSMGYGFVGFKDAEGARKAVKGMQGFVLDGHSLVVKFAGRGREDDVKGTETNKGGKKTAKMIVKNVPFEATKKDIRDLFGSQGQLKSVRLPKKFDSRTRGFAFLEFVSRHEAENAFGALQHTHLLGRHLVLEWAQEEEQDIDELRKKAGVGFGDGKAMPGKKRKVEMNMDGDDIGGGEDME